LFDIATKRQHVISNEEKKKFRQPREEKFISNEEKTKKKKFRQPREEKVISNEEKKKVSTIRQLKSCD